MGKIPSEAKPDLSLWQGRKPSPGVLAKLLREPGYWCKNCVWFEQKAYQSPNWSNGWAPRCYRYPEYIQSRGPVHAYGGCGEFYPREAP